MTAPTRPSARNGIVLGARLGEGATSVVHAATIGAATGFVVKEARPSVPGAVAALHHEARVLRHLAGVTAGVARLVRVLDDGRTVALLLTPQGTQTLGRWCCEGDAEATDRHLDLLTALACTLEQIHRLGVVHGDLSPANVVVHHDAPVLIDFGAASIDGASPPGLRGTVPYAAPELVAGAPVGPGTDRYALAQIAAALVLGPQATRLAAAERADALHRRGIAAPLAAVLTAAIDPDPARRPDHAAWLDALLSRIPTGARSAGRAGSLPTTGTAPADATADHEPADERVAGLALPIASRTAVAPAGAPDGAVTADLEPTAVVTREFGPRPPARPEPPGPPPGRWRIPVLAGAASLAVGAVLAVAVARMVHGAPSSPPPILSMSPPEAGPAAEVRPDAGPGQRAEPAVSWDTARAEATVTLDGTTRRFRIGAPGDQLLVGRWRCTGAPRPVLYRPSTGDLVEFGGWAMGGAAQSPAVEHRGARGGTLRRALDGGCDVAVIDMPTVAPDGSVQAR